MKKLFLLLALLAGVGGYLHYVQGWDFSRVKQTDLYRRFAREDRSATTTPIGSRGTGTRWEFASPMPRARAQFGAAELDGRIYAVGGFDGYGRTLTSVDVYDIATDTWSKGAPLPEARHHAAVVSDGERLFVVGGLVGITARPVDNVYVFDPKTNAWSEAGRLNDFRGAAGAAFVGDRVLVFGGRMAFGTSDTVEWYDESRSGWNGLASMSAARERFAVVSEGPAAYALGGSRNGIRNTLASMEAYDPELNVWTKQAEMPRPRSGFGAAFALGRIYAFGGETANGVVAEVDAYDPSEDAWTDLSLPLPTPRQGLVAVPYKNRIYVLGGGRRSGMAVSDANEVLILE